MPIKISDAVRDLLRIVDQLHESHPKKPFTLDGRLVGDIGEILVETEYDIELYDDMRPHHDGETPDGRRVQIKTTMKDSLTFPTGPPPDYYLGIKISRDGTFAVVFNGPGAVAAEAIKNRKPSNQRLHSISISSLAKLQNKVDIKDRIPKRP